MGIKENEYGLIFEHVTNLYRKLSSRFNLKGVEFGGYDLPSGDGFLHSGEVLEHQNMEHTSFPDNTFDYILHSDVLEHVDAPLEAVTECMRILSSNGVLLFSTPLYSGQYGNIKTAKLDNDNNVIFNNEEVYHGNPLSSKGVPVFTLFGID